MAGPLPIIAESFCKREFAGPPKSPLGGGVDCVYIYISCNLRCVNNENEIKLVIN